MLEDTVRTVAHVSSNFLSQNIQMHRVQKIHSLDLENTGTKKQTSATSMCGDKHWKKKSVLKDDVGLNTRFE